MGEVSCINLGKNIERSRERIRQFIADQKLIDA
jgi:hypothetical protein